MDNYRECLRQVSRYMTFAIGISAAMFLLIAFPQGSSKEFPLFGVSLSAPRWFVITLLLFAYFAIPFVVRFPVQRASKIVGMLRKSDKDDKVLEALCNYPSILISHRVIFIIVPLICSILMTAGLGIDLFRYKGFSGDFLWGVPMLMFLTLYPISVLFDIFKGLFDKLQCERFNAKPR